jgi:hypothetical protein
MSSKAGLGGSRQRWIWTGLILLALARFGVVVYNGIEVNRGDFYATLPGANVEDLNPELWNSPDLADSWGFRRGVFLYGPTQYLTMLPVMWLADTYAQVERFLLWAYGIVIGLLIYLLWRAGRLIQPEVTGLAPALMVTAAFFLPMHIAYLQREFEVVVVCITAGAMLAVVAQRDRLSGALIGYVTWFKFFSLIWVAYWMLRRSGAALLSFVATSLAVAIATQGLLGLNGFAGVIDVVGNQFNRRTDALGMCAEWVSPLSRFHAEHNTTWADARWALCSLSDRWPWLPASELYLALLLVTGGLFLVGFVRLERDGGVPARLVPWRRGLEVGLIVMASRTLIHAHYYYLTLLLVPLTVLLARYLTDCPGCWWRRAAWFAAYLSLTAFAIPVSVLSRVTGSDFWWTYMANTLYFPGVLLLFGLLLWEYLTIPKLQANLAEGAA